MAILSKPSRSYAAVDHDPNGLSEAGSVPYAYKHELKTFRPPLSETHLKRPGGLDGHHGSSFSPLPNAFMSSRQRKQQQEEGRRAEAEHMLDPDFRSTSNFSLDDSQAGPSRKSSRTAGGMLGGSVMRGTSSLSNFKGPGKKSQLSGVYVDAEGKMHDTEFDPFAAVAEMTRNKSRRRSAFGSERKRGSDSESTSSEDSVDKSGSRPLADAKRNEEALRQRRDSERKRFEDISGQAMKRRQSILSQRSGEERTTPSLKSTDEGAMSMLQHYHLDRLNNRARSSQGFIHQGSLHRSPLSPTFGHSPSSPLPTVADTDERPEKSTETTSMPPPAVPKSKVEIKPGGTKKVTGFDAPESPHPSSTIQTPRSASHLALSPARMSTSSRASRASTETAGERTKPAERPREEIFPETPAQTKKREERQRRQARLGYGGGASSSTRLMDSRAASSGARVLPEIEILDDDDPRVVIPTDGRSTRLQTKYTQADHVIRPFASSSVLDRPSSLRSVGLAGSGTKAPSEILDEGHGGYVPTRWAKGDKLLRVTEDDKERYRPKEWGGKTGDLAGKPEEWRPTAKEVLKKEWKDFSTHARFGLFKASKKLSRKADM